MNLSGARLGGIFGDIKNWRAIKSIKDANILGVEGAPEGFLAWALENGAVEMEPEAAAVRDEIRRISEAGLGE